MTDGMPLGSVSCARGGGARGVTASTCSAPQALGLYEERAHLLLRFSEAKELLRLSRNTVYNLAARGQIPGARKIGREWRFHRGLLLEWLACGAPRTPGRSQSR